MSAPSDWTELPLAGGGRSLVEASAGTGKTWTIGMLYLRLLLEQGLSPRSIIVATFTHAAAAELAERLRGKLLWALAQACAFESGVGVRDDGEEAPDSAWLRGRWRRDPSHRAQDRQRLQSALAQFDAAPISTLHSLCARILADHPFAAGALFRGRELIDGKTLERALADDLWRVIAQGDATQALVELARKADIARGDLGKYLPVLLQPDVAVGPADRAGIVAAIAAAVGDVAAWIGDVRTVLSSEGLVNRSRRVPKAWAGLADALEAPDGDVAGVLAEYRDDLAEAGAAKYVNTKGQDHPLVQRLVDLSPAIVAGVPLLALDMAGKAALRTFLAAARHWCRSAMQARLESASQSTFDQLLFTVRDALEPRDGQRALADALYAAWPVALVDEFQDTDPVQFGILDAIYRDGDGMPRGRLVMIGDPKQAIYRFRGGDVQAYERARAAVPEQDRLTLGTNHRSSRGYVQAINAFYAATGTRLGPPDSETTIHYQPVQASGRRDDAPLRDARTGAPIAQPLVMHELAPGDTGTDLEDRALRACAGQIVRALSEDGYRIGDRALAPGDIAVLLPSHAQIARLGVLLKALGVPCVAVSQASVFDTPTARELRVVLHAVIHTEDPRALRAALLSRLWGESLGAVQALAHDAAAWDAQAGHFHRLHEVLAGRGPLAVVDSLMARHAARLLETVEGERMLTDLRHLGELLQEAWEQCGGGERLMAWFADQMEGGTEDADAADARALRLESDAQRVKLMTLHVSKGLEFGVVFLPLMWKHARSRIAERSAQLLSDADGRNKHLVEGPARALVRQQEYEERYRMLYVALTRAIHACHVFVLSPALLETLALGDVPLNALGVSGPGAGEDDAAGHIARRAGWESHDGMPWHDANAPVVPRTPRALPAAPIGPLPRRHSFSSLVGGGRSQVAGEDRAAEDEDVVVAAMPPGEAPGLDDAGLVVPQGTTFHPELDALCVVAGADFGNAVHDIFEHRLPGLALTQQQDSVRAALHAFGVRPRGADARSLVEPLTARLHAVLETALGGAGGPRLIDLAATDMRAEMEFNYRLDGVSLRALRRACEAHGEPDLVPRHEQTLAGLMNGKIDLVFAHDGRFHVLDYKSNDLASGARPCLEDYAPAALERKMRGTGYRFQALLYVIALERYLRERLGAGYRRDRHLGDGWYLFVRATGLALPDGTPCGVWRHRFDDALLDAVQTVLGASEREAA